MFFSLSRGYTLIHADVFCYIKDACDSVVVEGWIENGMGTL
jgi:hypothetical protein